MKKRIALLLLLLFTLLICSACSCKHEWIDATCSNPRICARCEETEGEPLGHTWCDATCSTPKTCSVCNKVEGNKLKHNFGEWQIETEATVLDEGIKVRYCNSCQKAEHKSYYLSSFVQDDKFIFTPEEYRKLFFDNFVNLGYSKFGGAQTGTEDGQVIVSIIDSGYNNVGNIGFVVDNNTWKMASSSTEKGFEGIVMIISANTEFVANAMVCLIMSCDPTANQNVAKEVASCVLEEKFEFGGITYSLTTTENYYMITAVVTG